ncbi:hypothetical protein Rsub_08287 [Raphidocelis subcapitata]|uniref:FAD-binding FR-type domain-containing protein n=1 Tax=Raphidocelis subcapitata TaxID=307507 RepID=A0A2V0P5Y6_9CHLO|nr:hypothetical protein Rsub_08287 [Raphidocelis subcapitata]|eukprot:GBF95256.1 hypothetical protein Rsub_08287 [Raphidocelis subcapitata]
MHSAAAAAAAESAAEGPRVAARIVDIWRATPTVQGLRLEVDPGTFSFSAGQWVDFWAPGTKQIGGFSITSTPEELRETGTFDLAVKATQHPVAQWLASQAAPGAKVHVRVGGTFTLRPESLQPGRPSLFVAGGIGVTPLVSMIAELVLEWERQRRAARGAGGAGGDSGSGSDSDGGGGGAGARRAVDSEPLRAVLLYSSRVPEEFALLRRLLDLQAAARGALQVRLHCSSYEAPRDGDGAAAVAAAAAAAYGELTPEAAAALEPGPRRPPPVLLPGGARSLARRRMVGADLRDAVADLLAAAPGGSRVTAYVCGPPALSDSVVAQLEGGAEGVGEVVLERWW